MGDSWGIPAVMYIFARVSHESRRKVLACLNIIVITQECGLSFRTLYQNQLLLTKDSLPAFLFSYLPFVRIL